MSSGRHEPQEALAVETYVERRAGQWVVDIVVVFADEVVRTTINTYHTERMANIAASWIKRAAQRDFPGARRPTVDDAVNRAVDEQQTEQQTEPEPNDE